MYYTIYDKIKVCNWINNKTLEKKNFILDGTSHSLMLKLIFIISEQLTL